MDAIDALVIDPLNDSRMRLKNATASSPYFGKIILAGSFSDALSKMKLIPTWIVVFISSQYLEEEKNKKNMIEFIRQAKSTKHGQDSAYVLVLKAIHQKNTSIASGVLNGIDSFLLEPYSVNTLLETTTLAYSLFKQRKHAREEIAIQFLSKEIVNAVDGVAEGMTREGVPGEAIRKLRDLGASVKELNSSLLPVYYNTLISQFENARPRFIPEGIINPKARERLQQRLEAAGIKASLDDDNNIKQKSSGPKVIRKSR